MKKTDPEVRYLWAARRVAESLQDLHPDISYEILLQYSIVGVKTTEKALCIARGVGVTGNLPNEVRIEFNADIK